MKKVILVVLAAAILAVGYWGAAGWLAENRALSALQREYEAAQQQNEDLRQQRTALEQELNALEQQNSDANETLQSWKQWKDDLEAALAA